MEQLREANRQQQQRVDELQAKIRRMQNEQELERARQAGDWNHVSLMREAMSRNARGVGSKRSREDNKEPPAKRTRLSVMDADVQLPNWDHYAKLLARVALEPAGF